MKSAYLLTLTLALATLGTSSWAATQDEHAGHHPAGAASGPASKSTPDKSAADMARMDAQTMAMRQMHDRMMAANTPEERTALMAEHMKTMQDGMSMMNGMSGSGMGAKGEMKGGMKGDMPMHQMMEKRMEMMGATMQMMMDRLPATPAK